MTKLSSSIKLAGIAVATVLLAGGGVALAASVSTAASTTAAASHSPDADDSKSASGQQGQHGQPGHQGKSGDDCDDKAGAFAKPSARPTVRESERPDVDSSAGKPSSWPTVHPSQPDVDRSGEPGDGKDQCGNGEHGDDCDTAKTTQSPAPRPTTTAGKSDDADETGCQSGQHDTDGADHGQTGAPGTDHSFGQTTGSGQRMPSPHPTPTGSWRGDH